MADRAIAPVANDATQQDSEAEIPVVVAVHVRPLIHDEVVTGCKPCLSVADREPQVCIVDVVCLISQVAVSLLPPRLSPRARCAQVGGILVLHVNAQLHFYPEYIKCRKFCTCLGSAIFVCIRACNVAPLFHMGVSRAVAV